MEDLWALSEERFIEWRKIHDFPRLLQHFDIVLPEFIQWKQQYNLTNEDIIQSGNITQLLEKKDVKKKFALTKKDRKKYVYLTIQKWQENELLIVSSTKSEGHEMVLGEDVYYTHVNEIESYLDWSERHGRNVNILAPVSRSAPRSSRERVFINAIGHSNQNDFEILRMGGIEVPKTPFDVLQRGKYIEFANLCGLQMDGEFHFGEEGNLACSYCICDNWTTNNLNMPMLRLENCSLLNFKLIDSKLSSWFFYDTVVSGNFSNSQLQRVYIIGGNFNPLMQSCSLFDTELINGKYTSNKNLNGFKSFKKIYESQGEDKLAKSYYVMENEVLRSNLKGWNFVTKTLSYFYWQYGSKPHRIIYCSIILILLCSFIYWLNSDLVSINTNAKEAFNFGNSLYFSTITFSTLGYGDYSPQGWLKSVAALESFLGVINTGFLLAGYANNKY
ncbi:potassium channel family protein [Chryseobacterium sp. R2ACT005]|uniref:potassium channel family protein n=1 Tax=Chryseobacterium sp. R2ACT005 TaxID=3416668 RepID=UPI003CECE5C2